MRAVLASIHHPGSPGANILVTSVVRFLEIAMMSKYTEFVLCLSFVVTQLLSQVFLASFYKSSFYKKTIQIIKQGCTNPVGRLVRSTTEMIL